MSGTVLLKLTEADEDVGFTFSVPTFYTYARFLSEVIEAGDLPCQDDDGQPVRYVLERTKTGEILPPHVTVSQSKIVRGEVVCMHRSESPDLVFNERFFELHSTGGGDDSTPYWKRVLRFQAAGAYEDAIAVLVKRWQALYAQRRRKGRAGALVAPAPNPNPELELVVQHIKNLFAALITEQTNVTYFDSFYALFQDPNIGAFFAAYPDWKEEVLTLMLEASYNLGKEGRYQNARDFAVLALQIEPENTLAEQLESLAHQYVTLESTADAEEKLELARAIYQADKEYGTIVRDLREASRQNRTAPRRSEDAPALLVERPPTPAPPPPVTLSPETDWADTDEPPPPPKPVSAWSRISGVMSMVFLALAVCALMAWIITSH